MSKEKENIFKNISFINKAKMTIGDGQFDFFIPKINKDLNNKEAHLSDGPMGVREVRNEYQDFYQISFPSPSLLANSFDKSLLFEIGKAMGKEAKARNISCLLAPAINLKRNPLCGRNFEYYSEDPVLSGYLAASFIKGLESNNVASCLKHYLLNNQEYGRMTVSANVDDYALNNLYLKNFEIAVKEGKPSAIMTSYNRVNHKILNESKDLLDIPRKKWGFNGIYISDWSSISSKRKALLAGCDLEMPKSDSLKTLRPKGDKELIQSINVSSERIGDFLMRYMREKPKEIVINNEEENKNLSAFAVANSLVLLKNELNLLPLNKTDSIGVIGRLAEEPYYSGGGSAFVKAKTPLKMKEIFKENFIPFDYQSGYDFKGRTGEEYLKKAVELAKKKDKIILFLGSSNLDEFEGEDRKSMRIKDSMNELYKEIKKVNSNIIIVHESSSPVETEFLDSAHTILQAYPGGEMMNLGIFMVLFGLVSPSGLLSESWPKRFQDTPSYKTYTKDLRDLYHIESIYLGYRYFETLNKDVLFPFGYGLSYSKFLLSDLRVKRTKLGLSLNVKVKNIGEYDGAVSVLFYSSLKESKLFRPLRELSSFEKVFLFKNEEKNITSFIPYYVLNVFSEDNDMVLENGEYLIQATTSSVSPGITRSINIKSKVKINDIHDAYPEYFSLNEDSLTLNNWKKLYKKELKDKENKELDNNSLLTEFIKTKAGSKIKNVFSVFFLKKVPDAEKTDALKMLDQLPIGFLNTIHPVYTTEQMKILFDVANGVNPNYQDFLRMRPIL